MKRRLLALTTIFLLSSCSSIKLEKCYGKNQEVNLYQATPDILTFVNTNTTPIEQLIDTYSYLGENEPTYQVENYYYSTDWDTLFLTFYNNKAISKEASTSLSVADLIELEAYMLENFGSGPYRREYGEYIKVIRLYPDRFDVLCKNAEGCSGADPRDGVIDVYNVSKSNLYQSTHSSQDARIDILVHEYGHAFNYYNLHLTGSISPSYYLKLRLGDEYNSLYPVDLPTYKQIPGEEYYIQPTEIESDDYVELFYKNYDSTTYNRLSLKRHPHLQHLTGESREKIYQLYQQVLNLPRKLLAPTVIESNCNSCQLTVFSDNFNSQTIITSKFKQKLVANSLVEYQGKWYYQVIISPLLAPEEAINFLEQISTRVGYVSADLYTQVIAPIYVMKSDVAQINYVCLLATKCSKNNATGFHIRELFPFSYYVDLLPTNPTLLFYDYRHVKGQIVSINRANIELLQQQ